MSPPRPCGKKPCKTSQLLLDEEIKEIKIELFTPYVVAFDAHVKSIQDSFSKAFTVELTAVLSGCSRKAPTRSILANQDETKDLFRQRVAEVFAKDLCTTVKINEKYIRNTTSPKGTIDISN